jgi:hypothetical protein
MVPLIWLYCCSSNPNGLKRKILLASRVLQLLCSMRCSLQWRCTINRCAMHLYWIWGSRDHSTLNNIMFGLHPIFHLNPTLKEGITTWKFLSVGIEDLWVQYVAKLWFDHKHLSENTWQQGRNTWLQSSMMRFLWSSWNYCLDNSSSQFP